MSARQERRKAKEAERLSFAGWMLYKRCSNKIHTKGCCVDE